MSSFLRSKKKLVNNKTQSKLTSIRKRQSNKKSNHKKKNSLPIQKTKRTQPKLNYNLVIGMLAIAIISIILTFIFKFYSAEYFQITQFEFMGSRSISEDELVDTLSEFTSQNLFLLNKNKVEDTLLTSYVYFNSVKVTKMWPNKLFININEREPTLVMINLNGAYVIDEDARIIDIITSDKIKITNEDIDIINGFGNPNGEYVKTLIFSDWQLNNPDLNIKDFEFDEISLEDKLNVLMKLQNDLATTASTKLSDLQTQASATKYANLEQITIYENKTYNKFDFINKNILDISNEVINFFQSREDIIIKSISWRGNYLLVAKQTNGKEIVFGTKRNISIQLEDYLIISNQLNFAGTDYTTIDVSSKKISVK